MEIGGKTQSPGRVKGSTSELISSLDLTGEKHDKYRELGKIGKHEQRKGKTSQWEGKRVGEKKKTK